MVRVKIRERKYQMRKASARQLWILALIVCALVVSGCGGGSSPAKENPAQPDSADESNDAESPESASVLLQRLVTERGLTGDPAAPRGLSQRVPDPVQAPLEKLGQLLFFSKSLSGAYDVACASCHHPLFAGGDGLSLSVGVAALDSGLIGPGRTIDPVHDMDPNQDGGPNVPRNSQTVFNVAMYDRALLHDGSVFSLSDETLSGGSGQPIRTPESGSAPDIDAGNSLLEAQARFPLVSNREMRNFRYSVLADPEEYRQFLIGRLRGEQEIENQGPYASENWLDLFESAFSGEAEPYLTLNNVQRALAAYQRSMIFVDNSWKRYLQGDNSAISDAAMRGAILFLGDLADGGLGCHACHSGDRFTDEKFYNLGFPQIGRGRRADSSDPGRWQVTRTEADEHAFRTPGLLNVAVTGPYGHAGTFDTLAQLLHYHSDPVREVDQFFSSDSISLLRQFSGQGSAGQLYPDAERLTRSALTMDSFAFAESLLPGAIGAQQAQDLIAFLETLTDSCVLAEQCVSQWVPQKNEDPDGHMLVAGEVASNDPPELPGEDGYPEQIPVTFPDVLARTTFFELEEGCLDSYTLPASDNNNGEGFIRRGYDASDVEFGLREKHGWRNETWFSDVRASYEVAMFAGGVTATYTDGSCWPALVFSGGEEAGVVVYRSKGRRLGFEVVDEPFVSSPGGMFTGAGHVDLNGDYRRELFLANHLPGNVKIYSQNAEGRYQSVAELPMGRGTFGMSFSDIDGNGYPDFYLAHWSLAGNPGSAPSLWKNDLPLGVLRPYDEVARTSSAYVDQTLNFTPAFADITGDGRQDLLIASDARTSQTLQNLDAASGVVFDNVTERSVITDENGMAGIVADFFNDGDLDWFVGSIFDPRGADFMGWGESGNRLYRNRSTPADLRFEDVTGQAGDIADGAWSWGSCAADFNNNGFVDIFQVNGFGYIPEDVPKNETQAAIREFYLEKTNLVLRGIPPRLFINNGAGSFTESAEEWGLVYPSEGIGIACFDYDRDGDIDVVLVDQSNRMQFYENRTGHGDGHRFLAVRLVGVPPNTDALGARVYVTANVGAPHHQQTMLRVSQANSNFNGQNPPDLHFGLGFAETVTELRVEWPDGRITCHLDVPANQFLVIDQRDVDVAQSCPENGGG
jgi:enediyne biosynthesis protein E4